MILPGLRGFAGQKTGLNFCNKNFARARPGGQLQLVNLRLNGKKPARFFAKKTCKGFSNGY